MKYTLVGAGVIGGLMAAWLIGAGAEILYVDAALDHIRVMNERGLITRDPRGGDFMVPVKAAHIDDLGEPLEVVFLATKTQHTGAVMEKIAPLLKKDGYVVSLQNGINEHVIAEYVGRNWVAGASVNWAADYIEPGVIQFGGYSNFVIGELDGRITECLEHLREFTSPFQQVEISDQVIRQLQSKQVNICAMSATGITRLLIPGGMGYGPTQETIVCVALEAMQALEELGIELVSFDDSRPDLYRQDCSKEALQVTAGHYRPMVKNYIGLYCDLAVRHRKSEIDGTVGVTAQMGEKPGFSLPPNKRLVDMVKEIGVGRRTIYMENLMELKVGYERTYPYGIPDTMVHPSDEGRCPLQSLAQMLQCFYYVCGEI